MYVDITAVPGFDGAHAALTGDRNRVTASNCLFIDLPTSRVIRREIDVASVARPTGQDLVGSPLGELLHFTLAVGGNQANVAMRLRAALERDLFSIGGPGGAADHGAIKMGETLAALAIAVASPKLKSASPITAKKQAAAIRRKLRIGVAALISDQRRPFGGGRAPDAGDIAIGGESNPIALRSNSGESGQRCAIGQLPGRPSIAWNLPELYDSIAAARGLNQALAIRAPGESHNVATIESGALNGAAVDAGQIDVATHFSGIAQEGDLRTVWGNIGFKIAHHTWRRLRNAPDVAGSEIDGDHSAGFAHSKALRSKEVAPIGAPAKARDDAEPGRHSLEFRNFGFLASRERN